MREIAVTMAPEQNDEAPGVSIGRTIGSETMVLLDPFLLLDHMRGDSSLGAGKGFPRHPHRGIETLTLVFSGAVRHKDSLGNDDRVFAGETQWMRAGSGIFHEEYVEPGDSGFDGLQLWFNLPAARKFDPPAYEPARASAIPVVSPPGGGTLKLVAGTIADSSGKVFTGPVVQSAVTPFVADVTLPARARVVLPAPPETNAFAYVLAGVIAAGETSTDDSPQLAVFGGGDGVALENRGVADARFLFVSATALGEPVFQFRSLVLNTPQQMGEALADLKNGTFDKRR